MLLFLNIVTEICTLKFSLFYEVLLQPLNSHPWSACLDNLDFTFPIALYVKACEKREMACYISVLYLHYFAGRALSKQALARTESFCCCFDQFIYLLFSLIKYLFKVDLYSKPGRNGWLSATSVDHSIKWIEWCKRLYHNLLSHLEEWITWEYQISGLKDWAGAIDHLPLYEGKWSNYLSCFSAHGGLEKVDMSPMTSHAVLFGEHDEYQMHNARDSKPNYRGGDATYVQQKK